MTTVGVKQLIHTTTWLLLTVDTVYFKFSWVKSSQSTRLCFTWLHWSP